MLQTLKHYDLVIHFFSVSQSNVLSGTKTVRMISRVLLLEEQTCAESANALHDLLDSALTTRFEICFDTLMEQFTFVADCASTMPCIVGSSSSSRKVSFSEAWMGFITPN